MEVGDRVKVLSNLPKGCPVFGTITAIDKDVIWVDLGDRRFNQFEKDELEVIKRFDDKAIKFRAKRKDNGEWVEGAYFNLKHDDEREHIHHFIIPDGTPIPKGTPIDEVQVEIDFDTLCQFTGFYDYNGKPIYANDAMDNQTPLGGGTEMKFMCEWFLGGFAIIYYGHRYGPVDKNAWRNRFPLCMNNIKDLQVIGNKWDNPEMFEELNQVGK